MERHAMAAALIGLMLTCGVPEAGAQDFTMYGIGGRNTSELTCGGFLTERERPTDRGLREWWILGWISAANAEKRRVTPEDPEALFQYLKLYCERNPLNPFWYAMWSLDAKLSQDAANEQER